MEFKKYYIVLFFFILMGGNVLALEKIEYRYQNSKFETKIGTAEEWVDTGSLTLKKNFEAAPVEVKRKLYPVYVAEAVKEITIYSSSTLIAWNIFKMIENESTVSWNFIMSLLGVSIVSDYICNSYMKRAIHSYNQWVDVNDNFSNLTFELQLDGASLEYKKLF